MSKTRSGKFFWSGQVPTFCEGTYAAHPLDSIMRDIILKNHGRTIVKKAAEPKRRYRRWHKFDRHDPSTWPPAEGYYMVKIKPNYLDFEAHWQGDVTNRRRWMAQCKDAYTEMVDPWGWTEIID